MLLGVKSYEIIILKHFDFKNITKFITSPPEVKYVITKMK